MMDPDGLKGEILAAMTAEGFAETEGNKKLAAAIAKAVIGHIKQADVIGTCPSLGGPLAEGKII